jgi:hypothetical protein
MCEENEYTDIRTAALIEILQLSLSDGQEIISLEEIKQAWDGLLED